jgi:hypothetical protein
MACLEKVSQARSLSLRLQFCRPYHPHPPPFLRRRASERRVYLGNRPFCSSHFDKRLTVNAVMDDTNTSAAASAPIHNWVTLPSLIVSLPSIANSFLTLDEWSFSA